MTCVSVCIFIVIRNLLQWTVLCMASEKGHTEVVKLLVESGVDVNMMCDQVCV